MRYGYSLNVHPTEELPQLREAIDRYVCPIRDRVCPDREMGLALRLGGPGVRALAKPGEAARLGDELAARRLTPFTFNGFPLSVFTAGKVKESVYRPDWTEPERGELTVLIARALAEMSPDDFLTVSTLSGTFRLRGDDQLAMASQMLGVARELAAIEERTGKQVVLCLEPEPFTTLETTSETIAFFERWLLPEAELSRYLGVNFDVCHQAVVYEDVVRSLEELTGAGIQLGKVHVSAALKLVEPSAQQLMQLTSYDEPRYLHQSFVRRPDGRIDRYPDLGQFLADPGEVSEVRIHFHVPLSGEMSSLLGTTRGEADAALAWLKDRPEVCSHLVLETYTWEVLQERNLCGAGQIDLVGGISSELEWFQQRIGV